MFNVGNFVCFHGLNETFEWVNDVERYIDDKEFYEIVEVITENTIVVLNDSQRKIVIDIADYQLHTKESLRQHLTSNSHKYAAICNKVKQLYRKHNNSDSSFKFQGV